MADKNPSPETFQKMAAEHIDLANRHGNDTNIGVAGGAQLEAAARYAAFSCAVEHLDRTQFLAARKVNIDQITAQFRDMLERHYADFGDNYNAYLGNGK